MKIKEMLWQNRRDFKAIFECETCGATEELRGYDDRYFHNMVIPKMKCKVCGQKAINYQPREPKYDDGEVV